MLAVLENMSVLASLSNKPLIVCAFSDTMYFQTSRDDVIEGPIMCMQVFM